MRRYNFIYIIAFLIAGLLYYMSNQMTSKSAFFYGFAENKETEINHNEDISVAKIYVTSGQEVKKGDLLLEVADNTIPQKLDQLALKKDAVDQELQLKRIDIQNEIKNISTKRDQDISKIAAEIITLEQRIKVNKGLFEGLKTIEKPNDTYRSPDQDKVNELRANIRGIEEAAKARIITKENLITSLAQPSKTRNKLVESEASYYRSVKDRLTIIAPFDGLIGTINCKKGENVSAFTRLMSFYKTNPTEVKGFVHESMILEVSVGDKLEVSSTLHPDIKIEGEVIGLGSRIIEIPERLRKMPDFKTYGREIQISIPSKNRFLQKEKVMLNLASEESGMALSNLFSSEETREEPTTQEN